VAKPNELDAAIALLTGAFPNVQVEKGTIIVYQKFLADLDPELMILAVQTAIARHPYATWPTIAEIRSVYAEISNPDVPSTAEAWGQAIAELNSYSGYPSTHPLVKATLKAMGRQTIMQYDNMGVLYAHFSKAYEQIVAREKQNLTMLPEVREHVARLNEGNPVHKQLKALAASKAVEQERSE